MDVESNSTTLVLEDVVSYLLLEKMRNNNMEGLTKYALKVIGQSVDIDKGKFSNRNSNSMGVGSRPKWKARRFWERRHARGKRQLEGKAACVHAWKT
jgi:hypothetical protein